MSKRPKPQTKIPPKKVTVPPPTQRPRPPSSVPPRPSKKSKTHTQRAIRLLLVLKSIPNEGPKIPICKLARAIHLENERAIRHSAGTARSLHFWTCHWEMAQEAEKQQTITSAESLHRAQLSEAPFESKVPSTEISNSRNHWPKAQPVIRASSRNYWSLPDRSSDDFHQISIS
jgi:hypothetical protein